MGRIGGEGVAVPKRPEYLIQELRERYLDRYREAVHRDDLEEMERIHLVIKALTEAFWAVFHGSLDNDP